MTYPANLVMGFTNEGTFDPAELFAGEADIITDRGVCGATTVVQLAIIARDEDGLIVAWDPLNGAANKAGTFSGVGTAGDTITINGTAFTASATPAVATDFLIGGTATATATNFAAVANLPANMDLTHCRVTRSGAVVTVYSLERGYGGNNIAISESGTGFSFAGGATALSGGTDEGESKAIGIAAQGATVGEGIPFFTGGVFNRNILVWPASVNTKALQQAAFDRTNIQISEPIGVSTNITYP